MDSIKPEKDELDLHQKQKKRTRNAEELSNIPTVTTSVGSVVSLSRSAQLALILLFILVVGLAGMGYWQVQQQQKTIQLLDGQLTEANSYISQSKLIVARLEGQINQTDATMAQSGNELARELKFLDSEVRKLWDVANKRNKKGIQNNQSGLKTLEAALAATNATAEKLLGNMAKMEKVVTGVVLLEENIATINSELKSQKELLVLQKTQADQQKNRFEEQLALINQKQTQTKNSVEELLKSETELTANQQAMSNQLVGSLADVDTKLASQRQTIQTLVKAVGRTRTDSGLSNRLKAVETSMAGLDKVRGQLVQRIVSLDARINEMQLEMNALRTRPQVSKVK